jgi:hypothetical protein
MKEARTTCHKSYALGYPIGESFDFESTTEHDR